ncbi:hypothetical protein CYMTET_32764 [Cymbomonas tetramitiformis]|uniref:Uncharacterized protein n=1 Tax=Cymbomonas tetramitiformis TaxID=36881 RepID=A0AAE0KRK9_9CHLO|nr:hypothetical protein CYMTET_32764 [Cymbomonas tetramitiformis]
MCLAARRCISRPTGSDTEKLARLVIALRQEILSSGLEIDVFNFNYPEKAVHEDINKLVYDTLTYMVKPDSVADGFLQGTDSVSDRDGRRALIDLIKGCVPPAVRQKLQADHSPLRYPAKQRADLLGGAAAGAALSAAVPAGDDKTVVEMLKTHPWGGEQDRELGQGQRARVSWLHGVPLRWHEREHAGSAAAFCIPAGDCEEDAYTLAGCRVFRQASDSGASAFAVAVREYGAPALMASDGIPRDVDVSAYGFRVEDDCGDGLGEDNVLS